MGDFLKNGTKIGTCGNAYYATLEMLKHHVSAHGQIDDATWYIDPSKSCSFAFPFPEYDGKNIGEISNFHQGERVDFFFTVRVSEENTLHHKDICKNLHPDDGQSVNVFFPCPCSKTAKTSTNFDRTRQTFRLEEQAYHQKSLCISASCIYCGCRNPFSFEQALRIAEGLTARADALSNAPRSNPTEVEYLHQIIRRILTTYQ